LNKYILLNLKKNYKKIKLINKLNYLIIKNSYKNNQINQIKNQKIQIINFIIKCIKFNLKNKKTNSGFYNMNKKNKIYHIYFHQV